MKRFFAVVAVSGLILAACGGGGGPTQGGTTPPATAGGATCAQAGATLTVKAQNIAFDKQCLAAPAGQSFTITFDNKETLPHNVAIYASAAATQNLFRGETFQGPKVMTYNVPPIQAGTYFFRCDVHPQQMTGTFIVR